VVESPVPLASGASPKPKSSGSPGPAASAVALKTATKIVVYPDDAPPAPTPQPSGAVQTYFKRVAIVRGVVSPAVDVPLYGMGAVRFTVPKTELAAGRGFTVAVFTAGKRHHDGLVQFDAAPVVGDDGIASSRTTEPFTLKRGTTYLVLLYGDELPAAPPSVPSGYPQPGNNPFATPLPSGAPGQYPPGQYPPGQNPPGGATPFPPGGSVPYATPVASAFPH
jgi:hypothetical protein